jgi:cobalamin biosynthetic protein CobC
MAAIHHGGGLTAAIAQYGGEARDWLDLSTGINPNPPELPEIPPDVWNRLPDKGLVEAARRTAAAWYIPPSVLSDISPSRGESDSRRLPLAVPGTQSFIQILPKLVPVDRPIAILSPTYGEYAHCFRRAGFNVDEIRDVAWLRADHGALVVVNPNNPDGRILPPSVLLELGARMRAQGGCLHVDEAFGDSTGELTIAAHALVTPGLTVSRSFGKFFGMAGLRLGFVFAEPGTLDFIDASLGPWAVSGPALYFVTELMQRDRSAILQAINRRKAALQATLEGAGLQVSGGTSLFALVVHDQAAKLFEHLARSHILVRKFDYAPDWLRVGLAPDEHGDRKLALALASFKT